MPHHHHGGGEAPCFNALHCLAEPPACPQPHAHPGCSHGEKERHEDGKVHDHEDGKAHDHSKAHDHDCAGDECAPTQITATEPRPAQGVQAALVPVVFETHRLRLSCPECGNVYYTTLQTNAFRGAPPLEKLHTSYIVRAIPGRAPTVLA